MVIYFYLNDLYFQMGMAKLVAYFRRRAISLTDKRVRLMNEVISSIKLIKMYAWEVPFSKKVTGEYLLWREKYC